MKLTECMEEEIVVGMFDRELLGFPEDGIKLKSGRISPYYYNDRPCLSFSKELVRTGKMPLIRQMGFRNALAKGLAARFSELTVRPDHILGKAQAGTAPVAVGAYEAGMSYLWERVPEIGKTYGAHQMIEGDYEAGETVGLGDDVITDGKSKIEGAMSLRAVGLIPISVTIKFDREEGGLEMLEEHGYEVNAVTGLSKAVGFLLANGRIGNSELERLYAYHEALTLDGENSTFNP